MNKNVDVFECKTRNVNGLIEPIFDYTIDFICDIKDGLFEVSAMDVGAQKLDELKSKYYWKERKVVDFPDINPNKNI